MLQTTKATLSLGSCMIGDAGTSAAWWSKVGAAIFVLGLPGGAAAAQIIEGRTTDRVTGEAVRFAELSLRADSGLPPLETTVSDSTGFFQFQLNSTGPDSLWLVIRAAGYESLATRVMAPEPLEVVQLLIPLAITAMDLGEIQVSVRRRPRLSADPLVGVDSRSLLYGRNGTGAGYFLMAEDIDEIKPGRLTDLVTRVPGVRFTRHGIRLQGAGRCNGSPTYYVNGRRFVSIGGYQGLDPVLEEIQATHPLSLLAAVEVYSSSWQAPIEFQGLASGCGVVALWFSAERLKATSASDQPSPPRPAVTAVLSLVAPVERLTQDVRVATYPAVGFFWRRGTFGPFAPFYSFDWAPYVTFVSGGTNLEREFSHHGQLLKVATGLGLPAGDAIEFRLRLGVGWLGARAFPGTDCSGSRSCLALQNEVRSRMNVGFGFGTRWSFHSDWAGELEWEVERWQNSRMISVRAGLAWTLFAESHR